MKKFTLLAFPGKSFPSGQCNLPKSNAPADNSPPNVVCENPVAGAILNLNLTDYVGCFAVKPVRKLIPCKKDESCYVRLVVNQFPSGLIQTQ